MKLMPVAERMKLIMNGCRYLNLFVSMNANENTTAHPASNISIVQAPYESNGVSNAFASDSFVMLSSACQVSSPALVFMVIESTSIAKPSVLQHLSHVFR